MKPRFLAKKPVPHDSDGVVTEPTKRRRVARSPGEEADAARVREERAESRARMLGALAALSPSGALPGDPPVRDLGLLDVSHASPPSPLVRLNRKSGRGGPGTALVLVERHYDGDNGGECHGPYVVAYAEFADGGGYRARTRGAAIRRGELRPVAHALLALADRLDRESPSTSADNAPAGDG
ncbi:MAG: hypothetical protein IPF92_24850 [Myxococcales bacterium]|nr:hypothetical protein [Myxococcales bacterium]